MQPLAVGIGEVLWDVFPGGRRLGGAPANFAFHVSRLGCRGAVASRVGDDLLGREALARLDALGVDRSRIQMDPALPTGTVTVSVDAQGLPAYTIESGVAWEALQCPDTLSSLAPEADAICFGTLASRGERTLATVKRFLEAASPRCLRIFDVNFRLPLPPPERVRALLERCDVLKVNADELPQVAAMCGVAGEPVAGLWAQFNLKLLAVTLGDRGSLLCTAKERREEPGLSVQVVDTVGAGDAFTAALAAGLMEGADLRTIHRRAARLSAFVCTQEGATPETGAFIRNDPCFR